MSSFLGDSGPGDETSCCENDRWMVHVDGAEIFVTPRMLRELLALGRISGDEYAVRSSDGASRLVWNVCGKPVWLNQKFVDRRVRPHGRRASDCTHVLASTSHPASSQAEAPTVGSPAPSASTGSSYDRHEVDDDGDDERMEASAKLIADGSVWVSAQTTEELEDATIAALEASCRIKPFIDVERMIEILIDHGADDATARQIAVTAAVDFDESYYRRRRV